MLIYNAIGFYNGKIIRRSSLYIYCWHWHFCWTSKDIIEERKLLNYTGRTSSRGYETWQFNLWYVHANRLQNIYDIYFRQHEFNANCTPVLICGVHLWIHLSRLWRPTGGRSSRRWLPAKTQENSDFYYQHLSSPWPILLIQPKPSIRPTAPLATLNWSPALSKYFPRTELIREGSQRGPKTPDARSKLYRNQHFSLLCFS